MFNPETVSQLISEEIKKIIEEWADARFEFIIREAVERGIERQVQFIVEDELKKWEGELKVKFSPRIRSIFEDSVGSILSEAGMQRRR